jgi:hypothetical protein
LRNILMTKEVRPKVYVFWDNSNVFISSKTVADDKEGWRGREHVRIQFENLFRLAVADRDVANAVCVGSVPPQLATVWERLERAGVKVEKYERGRLSGKEQGIDQCLQLWMLRALADSIDPCVAVLLTGDGKGYEDGVGFRADLQRMHKKGWGIELVTWERTCNRRLKEWAADVGVFVRLEDYYSSVTFLEEGRRDARVVDLANRRVAAPHKTGLGLPSGLLIPPRETAIEIPPNQLDRERPEPRTIQW